MARVDEDGPTAAEFDPKEAARVAKEEAEAVAREDPWKHRSALMVCGICMYFLLKKGNDGRCKHESPTMDGYPVVFADEPGCGQHKLDENRL